jgi:type IV pilus assembly protein PilB
MVMVMHGLEADNKQQGPMVSYLNKLMADAIQRGASDLHFEPYEQCYRVRCRIDGVLQELSQPAASWSSAIAARLKVMAQLDIAEKRLPQDGRMRLRITPQKTIDVRLSTLPTLHGEKLVMRILDSSNALLAIDALGYSAEQQAQYQQALQQAQGMILVTGPTGSGKTLSLYSGLNILNTPERNISSAEDPIEINLVGINQVQINQKIGFTFAEALRAFLRQDPDVLMVGEIRDRETAEIAIKAAQTGHLVLSTLHTNSAAESLTRLLNMGIPAYNIATSVTLIIAQRLVRLLCTQCKQAHNLPLAQLHQHGFTADHIASMALFSARGCEHCNHGYKGRTGIYEVMPISASFQAVIMAGARSLQLAKLAPQHRMQTLRQAPLGLAAAGLTSVLEANRVSNL